MYVHNSVEKKLLYPFLAIWLGYGKACPLSGIFAHLETLYSL